MKGIYVRYQCLVLQESSRKKPMVLVSNLHVQRLLTWAIVLLALISFSIPTHAQNCRQIDINCDACSYVNPPTGYV